MHIFKYTYVYTNIYAYVLSICRERGTGLSQMFKEFQFLDYTAFDLHGFASTELRFFSFYPAIDLRHIFISIHVKLKIYYFVYGNDILKDTISHITQGFLFKICCRGGNGEIILMNQGDALINLLSAVIFEMLFLPLLQPPGN